MAARSPLVVDVADLLARSGQRRHESLDAVLDDLAVVGSRVPEDEAVHVEVDLESVNEGVVAKGVVEAAFEAECRRCLRPVRSNVEAPVLEIFEDQPTEDQTHPLRGGTIDLEPVAREAVLLGLPLAPVCRDDCAGLCPSCGADRNVGDCGCDTSPRDDRWAALDDLRFDD